MQEKGRENPGDLQVSGIRVWGCFNVGVALMASHCTILTNYLKICPAIASVANTEDFPSFFRLFFPHSLICVAFVYVLDQAATCNQLPRIVYAVTTCSI